VTANRPASANERDVAAEAADAALGALAADAWETDPVAMLFVRPAGELVAANGAGRALLHSGDVLTLANGRLTPALADDANALRQACARRWRLPTAFAFRNSNGEMALCAHVRTLPSLLMNTLRCQRFAPRAITRWAPIGDLFNLTPAERRIASRFIAGEDPADIARREGIALATVRSHIKSIYRKFNVNSRAALFELALRVPAGGGRRGAGGALRF